MQRREMGELCIHRYDGGRTEKMLVYSFINADLLSLVVLLIKQQTCGGLLECRKISIEKYSWKKSS